MIIPDSFILYINIAIVCIYVLFIVLGYIKGFLYELIGLLYTIASVIISWIVAPIFASLYPIINISDLSKEISIISKFFDINSLINTAIYFIICFLVLKLVHVLITLILKLFNKIPVLGTTNKILGGLFGIVNATLVTIALSLLLSLPIFSNGNYIKEKTYFKLVSNLTSEAINLIVDNIDLSKFTNTSLSIDLNSTRDLIKTWFESFK